MEMAKITPALKAQIHGKAVDDATWLYNAVQDINGEWFIGLEEATAGLQPGQYIVTEYQPPVSTGPY